MFGWCAKAVPTEAAAVQAAPASPEPRFSENVVGAYGRFLDTMKGGSLDIHDEGELPYPKWQITLELLGAIQSAPTPVMRSALEIGLLQLANFQPRIGKTLRAPTTQMTEIAQAERGKSVKELAHAISAIGDTESDRRYQMVRRYVEAEAAWLASLVR